MALRVGVLGAGFGGLELATILSNELGDQVDVALVDQNPAFVFGFSKLEVMFGNEDPNDVRHAYRDLVKPGVRFVQSRIESIDTAAKRVVTPEGTLECDVLVIALGADVDPAATPGLVEGGEEFYTMAGAVAARDALARFTGGSIVVGVTALPFKCPPAPSEAVLLLHEYLEARGLRTASEISLVMPTPVPVPPSPDASRALLAAFAERRITFVKDARVAALDPERRVVMLGTGVELPYALFLGVPVHRVPQVVVDSGLAAHSQDWIAVDKATLATTVPDVYAIGDVTGVGTPKAGVFAEGAARVVARAIVARVKGGGVPGAFAGQGSCYVDFGHGQAARVDVDFLSGPKPTSVFHAPTSELAVEKTAFGSSRLQRWFGA